MLIQQMCDDTNSVISFLIEKKLLNRRKSNCASDVRIV